jgi:hypothetical protein
MSTTTLDLKRTSKTIKIFAVVQFGLVALLAYTAFEFQQRLLMLGRGNNFMYAVIAASLVQLLLFFPIKKFAAKEADRDLYLATTTVSKEEMKAFSKKKRFSDIIKMSTFSFFVIFLVAAPGDPFVLSVIYYSFILTILSYLQCYNFAAKKLMKERSNA